MKNFFVIIIFSVTSFFAVAQVQVDVSGYNKTRQSKLVIKGNFINIQWPSGNKSTSELVLDMESGRPLFKNIRTGNSLPLQEIAGGLDPCFILTVGKRTLDPKSGGWDVFFDRVPTKPYKSYLVNFDKHHATVRSVGIQTVITVSSLHAEGFEGALEITLYNGSPLFNVAAVVSTKIDSTAILYDAGLVNKTKSFEAISWTDTKDQQHTVKPALTDAAIDLMVRYRTIIAGNKGSNMALFPAPHQYFYPLDEAFNLKFTWYGNNYRNMLPGFGIGIRQDPLGDKRYVPWFNAPPGTLQRLNFFCLLSLGNAETVLNEVKKFTHGDVYPSLPGYKTMQSHFHNEFISSVVMKGKPIPEEPGFVKVFKALGVNIVHLAEFHGPGHPKGPDDLRLLELNALFTQCERLSGKKFLLLPGEEANNFYGGHWLAFFPKPVYWVMSRKQETPFITSDPTYGKVYHLSDKEEMFQLLKLEKGLSWTAHARTKASTGFPDAYKEEDFFKSDRFMGAAWKAIPADLSLPTLSKRVLNLMDDMNNWGLKKHIIGEADLFTIEPENEMYAHLNVNYLKLDNIPQYKNGWQPVLDVLESGNFFTTTGEILLPSFTINGKEAGETLQLETSGKATIKVAINWTYPLNFAEIISGDGKEVYRERINLNDTPAFGSRQMTLNTNLKNRSWVRFEVWDVAANGAFTQTIWLKPATAFLK